MQNKKSPLTVRNSLNNKRTIENLSNIIFGLALSIGSLTLINSIANSNQSILNGLITFGFSFLVIIFIWLRYNKVLDLLTTETNTELILNIAMLFLVVIEPYLFNLLHSSGGSSLAFTTALYGIDVGGMLLSLGVIYALACYECANITDNETLNYYRLIRNGLLFAGVIFVISTLPIFWQIKVYGVTFRFIIWFASILIGLTYRRIMQIRV